MKGGYDYIMLRSLFNRQKEVDQPNQPINQAKKLKPGQRYHVIATISREIIYGGSYETFDLALARSYDILTDTLSNAQAYALEKEFDHKQKKFDYSTNTVGMSYDRSRNRIQAWANSKENVDVKVLVY